MNEVPVSEVHLKPPHKRRHWSFHGVRYGLMAALPLALLAIAGWYWASHSRFVSTDNAYLKRDIVQVSADVAGRIVQIAVHDDQIVQPGQLLFEVDPTPYQAKLTTAEATVTTARLHVETLRAAWHQAQAAETSAEELAAFEHSEYQRQKALLASGTASRQAYDQALHAANAADLAVEQAKQAVNNAIAALAGDPNIATDAHPEVRAALATRDAAALDLAHCDMRAPIAGHVGNTTLLTLGYYAMPGVATFSLVATESASLEANFKETDLVHLRVGQPATVTLDAYPDRPLAATVTSLGGGTGAEFALLPPQNATGNWVKVVQRVPVRLALTALPKDMTVQTGLSATVTVDTGYVPALAKRYFPQMVADAP